MKRSLVEYLRCPLTGTPLRLIDNTPANTAEISSGRLQASAGREYAIVDGVPVLLLPEIWAPGQAETRASFSEKWRRAPNYREATHAHYMHWYLERYGFQTLHELGNFLSSKRHILDAGTGHGRDAELFARNSQATVFAVDISDGIYNAYRDLHHLDNLHLVQADLVQLPFPKGFFDFISCDQVIHHTPNTHQALLALLDHIEPGGHIAFYVYKKKGPVREYCDDLIRQSTTRMSPDECLKVCEAITKFGKSLSEMNIQIEVPEDIPILEIKSGQYDLQRFLYWNMFKCYWNDTLDWDSNVITNFDWYHPRHAHRHTPEEVHAWCESIELEMVRFNVVESGISVLGRKPV